MLVKLEREGTMKVGVVAELIVGDDLVGVEVAILELLVMAAALEGVAGSDELAHLAVELGDPK